MIKKLRIKIVLISVLSIFSLLVVILSIVNVTNFVMVADDADRITLRIQENDGQMGEQSNPGMPGSPNPMGPGSRDMLESIRYFTYSEETDNLVTYKMSSISQEEAILLGRKLLNKADKGWVNTVYRYRTYIKDDVKYVAVIDQARELTPSYRILIISLVGSAVGLIIVTVLMLIASKKLVKPIEDSDNKQRRFIADAAIALKSPVSVISLDNATLTNEYGEQLANKSIRKQVEKLIDLAEDLNALTISTEVNAIKEEFNLTNVLKSIINQYHWAFSDNNKELHLDIQEDVKYIGDDGMFKKMFSEIIENALKYADKEATISLKSENDRITLEFKNDSKGIPEGTLDRVFEKFYRLDYKDHSQYDGSGVGLSIVKEIVEKHHGRVIARGENDMFILKIEL